MNNRNRLSYSNNKQCIDKLKSEIIVTVEWLFNCVRTDIVSGHKKIHYSKYKMIWVQVTLLIVSLVVLINCSDKFDLTLLTHDCLEVLNNRKNIIIF